MIDFDNESFSIEYLKKIKNLIKSASFISMDCEFTSVSREDHIFDFDSQKQIYQKYKQVIKGSELLQVGMTIFENTNNQKYKVNCFNFNLFKDKTSRKNHVKAENSCLFFLAKYNFSFKKCFYNGIDYKSLTEIEYYQKLFNAEEVIQDISFLENIEDSIYETEIKEEKKLFERQQYPKSDYFIREKELISIYKNFLKDEKSTLKIDLEEKDFINYIGSPKSVLYNLIEADNLIQLKGKKKGYLFKKKSDYQKQKHQMPHKPNYYEYFNFALIFHFIHLYKIPVVFHNGLYDYMYIYDKVFGELPNTLEEFMRIKFFEEIYDTKTIVSTFPDNFSLHKTQLLHMFHKFVKDINFDNYSIETKKLLEKNNISVKLENQNDIDLNKALEQNPTINNENNNEESSKINHIKNEDESLFYDINFSNNENYHQAGYDSLLTGVVFIYLRFKLKNQHKTLKNVIAQKHIKKFYITKESIPQGVDLNYQKKFEKFSFFIKWDENLIDNFDKDILIEDIGKYHGFTVDDRLKGFIFIKFLNISDQFDINLLLNSLQQKHSLLEFFSFEKYCTKFY